MISENRKRALVLKMRDLEKAASLKMFVMKGRPKRHFSAYTSPKTVKVGPREQATPQEIAEMKAKVRPEGWGE